MNIVNKKSIALCGLVLGLFLTIIPFFILHISANTTGATITISGVYKSNGDGNRIEQTIENINEKIQNTLPVQTGSIAIITRPNTSKDYIDISIDNNVYSRLQQTDKQEFMSICLNEVQNSTISNINKTKIYNFFVNSDPSIAGLVRQLSNDVKVDMPRAYAWFKPFSGPLGILLGCVTIAIFALLGLTIVIDIAFITISPLQWILTKPSKDGGRPMLISLEAWDSVKIAESQHTGALGVYFKKKVGQIIVLSICILYLVSGNIFALVARIVDYFQGLASLLTQ